MTESGPLFQDVHVSGLPTYEEQKITFPSGVFGVGVEAFLSSVNATFGFNNQPHKFDLEYIPETFTFADLPTIGQGVSFTIGDDFFIKGRIVHADYNKSARGNILSVTIEDLRSEMNDFYIDTFGIFGDSDAPSINIVDVRYWYLQTRLKTHSVGRQRAKRDLTLIQTNGASYRQIYEAVEYFENDLGTVTGLLAQIPTPQVIEAQLPLDADGYRFQFKSQPFLEALGKIMNDIAYDFYYNMSEDRINVINRKFAVSINAADIPIAGDTAPKISLRYGNDEAERSTNVRLYGGEMEGALGNGGRLMTQIGAYGLPSYDLGVTVGNSKYISGWTAKLKYFGPDGFLNEYIPSDAELAASLKGLEWWARERGLDNRLDNFTIDAIGGKTVQQPSLVGSGLGLLLNRRQAGRSWIMEWYERVRTFASNHYGRTYILDPASVLYGFIDDITIQKEAWCNLENQAEGGIFNDDYKISDTFKFLAPFYNHDNNKLKPFARFPFGTKWGQDGEQVPASFEQWNEDKDHQFVPIEVFQWDSNRKKFNEDFLEIFEDLEKGIGIRLPQFCWDLNSPDNTSLTTTVDRIGTLKRYFDSETTIDIANPLRFPTPYLELNPLAASGIGVQITANVKRRYGFNFPSIWASGSGPRLELNVEEDFVPWNYEPRGTKRSVDLLEDEATSFLDGRVTSRNSVTFAESVKVGLPVISFDNFANQQLENSAFGRVDHGITNLSLSRSTEWWETKYSVKSHFPQFIQVRPVNKAIEEDFAFAIKRIEARDQDLPDINIPIGDAPRVTSTGRATIKGDDGIEHTRKIQVEIIKLFNKGTAEQYYLSRDKNNIEWPRALAGNFSTQALQRATAVDGFLQVGMDATYNIEKDAGGGYAHYYTGGVELNETKVTVLTSAVTTVLDAQGSEFFVADIATLPTEVSSSFGASTTAVEFNFLKVPFIDNENVDTSLIVGDKVAIVSHGNKQLIPDQNYNPVNGAGKDDLFIINSGATADSTLLATVTIKPSASTGRDGAIQTFEAAGGKVFTDGQIASTGGSTIFNVIFVGVDPFVIEVGDPCVCKQFQEVDGSDAQFRLVCMVIKPLMIGTDTFGA